MKKWALGSVALLLTVSLVSACGGAKKSEDKPGAGAGNSGDKTVNSWERVKNAGKLVVAIDPTYPPMESDGDKGGFVGFDIDFATELSKRLGVKVEFQGMEWKGILAGLTSKRYDVIISSMNITDERKQEVDFVQYVSMSQVFVGKKGSSYKSEKDLAGKIVAVQADTTSHEWVQDQQKKGLAIKDVKAFGGATEAFAAVKAGHADLIVIDEPVGKYYAKQDPATFEVTGEALAAEPVGIAIRKVDKELAQEISKAVSAMQQNGFTKKLETDWFGSELGK